MRPPAGQSLLRLAVPLAGLTERRTGPVALLQHKWTTPQTLSACPTAPAPQDTSSSSHPTLTKLLSKAEAGGAGAAYEGAYTCVRSYGQQPIQFSLHALLTGCPSGYDAEGAPLMCGSPLGAPEGERRYSECTPAGQCVCSGQWAKPVPTVFPGAVGGGGGGWAAGRCEALL